MPYVKPKTVFATVALCALGWLPRAGALERYPVDEQDAKRVVASGQWHLFERGEAALSNGDWATASDLFSRVAQRVPGNALVARRECQALAGLGEKEAAIEACARARKNRGSAMDIRASVAALLSGPKPPSPQEVAHASLFADRAVDLGRNQPWGHAARCDIARKLGDVELLRECLYRLELYASEHYETRRARKLLAKPVMPPWVGWAWGGLAMLALATLAHSAWRRYGAWKRMSKIVGSRPRLAGKLKTVACLFSVGLFVVLAPGKVAAQSPGPNPFIVDLDDPESSVPPAELQKKSPLEFGYFLMELTRHADEAFDKADYQEAAKYYRAVAKAVPDRAVGFIKLCQSYERLGDLENAIEACRGALGAEGLRKEDFAHFVRLLLQKPATLSAEEVEDIDEVVKHLAAEKNGDLAEHLACELAVKLDSADRLASCTQKLDELAPGDPHNVVFKWTLAVSEGDSREANRLLARAREIGVEKPALERMERTTLSITPRWQLALSDWRVWGGGLLALGALGFVLFSRRHGSGKRAPSSGEGTKSGPVKPAGTGSEAS